MLVHVHASGESSLCHTKAPIIFKNGYNLGCWPTTCQNSYRDLVFTNTAGMWYVFPWAGHLKKEFWIKYSWPYRNFSRNTRIYPAFRAENFCEFVNQIHSWEAGVWVVLYPPQHILQIWSLVPRSWSNTGRARDLGIEIQHFHSIFFLPSLL